MNVYVFLSVDSWAWGGKVGNGKWEGNKFGGCFHTELHFVFTFYSVLSYDNVYITKKTSVIICFLTF